MTPSFIQCYSISSNAQRLASLVERIGRLPADAAFIDCEQGSATRLTNMTSLVRLFDSRDWVIERYVRHGVDTIVVPRLESGARKLIIGICARPLALSPASAFSDRLATGRRLLLAMNLYSFHSD
jgi:hypothetical protein